MRYLTLIWPGIWRRRARSVLVLLQIVIGFGLFGVLQGLKSGWQAEIDKSDADVLLVESATGRMHPLPMAHRDRILSVPGVEAVMVQNFLIGTYQRPDEQIVAMATELDERTLRIAPGMQVEPSAVNALAHTRNGALVGDGLARRYGWKTGTRVSLQSPLRQQDGSQVWTFDVLGTFSYETSGGLDDMLLINNSYLDEARAFGRGTVGRFGVKVDNPRRAIEIGHAIDALFRNSQYETRTQSLREMALSQMQQFGDLGLIVQGLVGAVFFALMFSTCALFAQSLRERLPELAILKAVGYSDGKVVTLIAGETLALWLVGAACGLALSVLAFPFATRFVSSFDFPRVVVAVGVALAAIMGLLSAVIPIWRGWRLQVADVLAGR